MCLMFSTRPGVDKVKPKVWLSNPYTLIDLLFETVLARLFHNVFFNMGNLHFVLPALNMSTLNAGNK